MMDIVERLVNFVTSDSDAEDLMAEAADEIEQLRKRLKDDAKNLRDEFAMATLGKTSFTCRAYGDDYYITHKDEMVKLIWDVADAMMETRGTK
jgi:hypothetical protein